MTYNQWTMLDKSDHETYVREYKDFMYNSSNIGNCSDCPENFGHSGHECNGHPCGQQNCWVKCHCEH